MSLSKSDWNRRFIQQAQWTRAIRGYLIEKSGVSAGSSILDVGCGTGAVEMDWENRRSEWPPARREAAERFYGLDIRRDFLRMAARQAPAFDPIQGDGRRLPFASRRFEASFCHFLLLWIHEPVAVLREMLRVTRPGGAVMAFAEPDYGGRIDFPAELGQIGDWQLESLRRQGADPQLGRKLRRIFQEAGLTDIEAGVLGGRWNEMPDRADMDAEWTVIESDLELLELAAAEAEQLNFLKKIDEAAWRAGTRILYVPIFYAMGMVPAR